jgi:hypothetical protein
MGKKNIDFNHVLVQKTTTIKGGLMPKACPLPVMEVAIGSETIDFVHLNKRCEWLCRVVSGEAPHGRPLSRVNLIDRLAEKLRRRCNDLDLESDNENETQSQIDDPMASLAFDDEPADTVVATSRKTISRKELRCTKRRTRNTLMRVQMPREPPEKNPKCKAMIEICMLIQNTKSVWINVEHLPWAVAYMHEQWKLGGVDAIEDEPAESPVKSKVIKWDFQHDCWVASVCSESTKTEKRLKPFDAEVKRALQETQGNDSMVMEGESDGRHLSYDLLKTTAYTILDNWIQTQG